MSAISYCLFITYTATIHIYSSVSIVTRLWAGRLGFDSRQGQEFFPFATAFRPALGLTQPPNQ